MCTETATVTKLENTTQPFSGKNHSQPLIDLRRNCRAADKQDDNTQFQTCFSNVECCNACVPPVAPTRLHGREYVQHVDKCFSALPWCDRRMQRARTPAKMFTIGTTPNNAFLINTVAPTFVSSRSVPTFTRPVNISTWRTMRARRPTGFPRMAPSLSFHVNLSRVCVYW